MTRFLLQRLLLLPLLLFVFSVTVFAIIQAPPGDFLTAYTATLASSGSSIGAEQLEALRRRVRPRPAALRPVRKWMWNLLQGNLGLSLEYQRPNTELIGERLVLTVVLALFSFVFTWLVAVPAGIYAATHQRSVVDYVLTVLNYVGVATPELPAGAGPHVDRLLLLRDQRHRASSRPSSSTRRGAWAGCVDLLQHIWLPAVVLGVAGTAAAEPGHAGQPPRRAATSRTS